MTRRSLVGTWTLVSCEFKDAEGNVSYPFGRDASGYLTYTPDGYMWTTTVSPHRVSFTSPDMRNATTNEKVAAFDTYVSYCGTYELHGDTVIHHVRASLFPNWVGGDQKRIIEWVGDNLRLSTPPIPIEGRAQTGHLLWRPLGASLSQNHCTKPTEAMFVRQDDRSEQQESRKMTSPGTQNPVQYWQLTKRLTVQQAAERIGISQHRYREVVVSGNEHFTQQELQRILSVTGIAEGALKAWEERPKGDTKNPPAR